MLNNEPKYPALSFRPWHGMTLGIWLSLLSRNRFGISPVRLPLGTTITLASLFNSMLRQISESIYAHRAEQTEIKHAPLFIIGHWRTGTTLLHELLSCDARFGFASTYACMAPHHFLMTERFLSQLLPFMLPKQRPMDNMSLGWGRPQEEEFALLLLGLPSIYSHFAFPLQKAGFTMHVDPTNLPEQEIRRFREGLLWFIRRLTLKNPHRLVLKSPLHTFRIELLADLFPAAQFIHMVRNPFDVVPSTLRMWEKMVQAMGLNTRQHPDMETNLFNLFTAMYRRFEQSRPMLNAAQLCEVRYEELVSDPIQQIERIYQELSLGDFDPAYPAVAKYLDTTKNYRPNHYGVAAELSSRIEDECGDYIQRYGYLRNHNARSLYQPQNCYLPGHQTPCSK